MSITPANNLLGHGFFQIRAGLFFQVFRPENGYSREDVLLFEEPFAGHWYEVRDPAEVKERVELVNTRPAYLIACRRREQITGIFAVTPQQSDYSSLWRENEGRQIDVEATRPRTAVWWKRMVPLELIRAASLLRPYRKRFYERKNG